jgi:hypothetical protein
MSVVYWITDAGDVGCGIVAFGNVVEGGGGELKRHFVSISLTGNSDLVR